LIVPVTGFVGRRPLSILKESVFSWCILDCKLFLNAISNYWAEKYGLVN